MSMSAALALTLAVASALCRCNAFNLDVQFPIRFVSSVGEDTHTYGTSVLLHAGSADQRQPWVQIGEPAPRDTNGTKIPGQVFRCRFREECQKMKFTAVPGVKTHDNFLGGAMASQYHDKPGVVVTCASRWHDSTPQSGTYLFTGACNWMHPERPGARQSDLWIRPLLDKSRVLSQHRNPVVFDWAIGQAGFSAHFVSSDRATVVLGAPGVENWRGGVVVCEPGSPGQVAPGCRVPKLPAEAIGEFDYFGYQVTSGEFFEKGETLLAVSAPRAGKVFHGMVRVLRLPQHENERATLVTSLTGDHVGSYFGGSLATGDFNSDSYDDLVVGAPLFSGPGSEVHDGDVGAVYQFLGGKSTGSFRGVPEPRGQIQGKVQGGRFGHSVACPGDLDKDGYPDLVVGAPYENDGRGAVYVFNGGPDGLSSGYSQRILALRVDPLGRGFGISLSPAVDIDSNNYSDLAVGSYGAVVVLRSHPVVKLSLTLSAEVDRVPQNATEVTFRTCIDFDGFDAPQGFDVLRIIEVRSSSGRDVVSLVHPTSMELVKTLTTEIFLLGREKCHDLVIQIKEGSKYLESIVVTGLARLGKGSRNFTGQRVIDGTNPKDDGFCKLCPVELRIMDSQELKLEFENECKNQTCIADLGIHCHFMRESSQTATHVVGSLKELHLVATVGNQGEPAYDTKLVVAVPLLVSVANVPSNCEFDVTTSRLTCKVGDLTSERNSSTVSVSLDMSAVLQVGNRTLDFLIIAQTRSKQKVPDNNKIASLVLIRDAKLAIFGKAVGRGSYRYGGGNSTAPHINFAHEFSVEKIGESPIDDAMVRVRYPIIWRPNGADLLLFLEAYQPDVLQDGQSLTCTSTETYLDEKTDSEGLDSDVRAKRETSPPEAPAVDVLAAGDAAKPPNNETFFLGCDTDGVRCAEISCVVRPLRVDSTVRIVVRMRLNVTALESFLGGKRVVSLSTHGEVSWEGEKMHDRVSSTTLFLGATEVKAVASWIIALSIAGGLLLFFFVVMGLIKAGFFQRKQKKELEALIEQEEEVKAINRQSQMLQDMGSDVE